MKSRSEPHKGLRKEHSKQMEEYEQRLAWESWVVKGSQESGKEVGQGATTAFEL